MAEPRVDRVTLRREICRDLGMPFFRRWPSGLVVQDTATSGMNNPTSVSRLVDSRFTQRRNYWNKQWIYDLSSGEERIIVDFIKDQKALIPEYDFVVAPVDSPSASASTFEILAIHSPSEIHLAIDDAIIEAFPSFFDAVEDETMVVEEDKRSYNLIASVGGRGVLSNPLRIKSIWVEEATSGGFFVPDTASTTTNVVNADAGFSQAGVDSTWSISVFAGTGSGQYTEVTAAASANGLTISALGTALDTSSQVRFWQRTKETYAWRPITAITFDAKDYPTTMRMIENMNEYRGMRFRISYIGEPQSLTSDTSSTVIPKKYIKHQAMAKLLRQRARRLPGEAAKYVELAQQDQADADRFKISHSQDLPDQTLWTEEDYAGGSGDGQSVFNPMDW